MHPEDDFREEGQQMNCSSREYREDPGVLGEKIHFLIDLKVTSAEEERKHSPDSSSSEQKEKEMREPRSVDLFLLLLKSALQLSSGLGQLQLQPQNFGLLRLENRRKMESEEDSGLSGDSS